MLIESPGVSQLDYDSRSNTVCTHASFFLNWKKQFSIFKGNIYDTVNIYNYVEDAKVSVSIKKRPMATHVH